jgi:hypothetical protein
LERGEKMSICEGGVVGDPQKIFHCSLSMTFQLEKANGERQDEEEKVDGGIEEKAQAYPNVAVIVREDGTQSARHSGNMLVHDIGVMFAKLENRHEA